MSGWRTAARGSEEEYETGAAICSPAALPNLDNANYHSCQLRCSKLHASVRTPCCAAPMRLPKHSSQTHGRSRRQ